MALVTHGWRFTVTQPRAFYGHMYRVMASQLGVVPFRIGMVDMMRPGRWRVSNYDGVYLPMLHDTRDEAVQACADDWLAGQS